MQDDTCWRPSMCTCSALASARSVSRGLLRTGGHRAVLRHLGQAKRTARRTLSKRWQDGENQWKFFLRHDFTHSFQPRGGSTEQWFGGPALALRAQLCPTVGGWPWTCLLQSLSLPYNLKTPTPVAPPTPDTPPATRFWNKGRQSCVAIILCLDRPLACTHLWLGVGSPLGGHEQWLVDTQARVLGPGGRLQRPRAESPKHANHLRDVLVH